MTLFADGIGVRAGDAHLLRDVSLAVEPGEVVAVVGPNGAGKSTLLRVLAGDVRPNSGAVSMLGRPLAAWSLLERARRRAVLEQESGIAFPFTVAEVVRMGRSPHHGALDPGADAQAVAGSLAAVSCGHLADRGFASLSGGERQRVQLARVLAQIWVADAAAAGTPATGAQPAAGRDPEPRFLLLDEPTSSLDPAYQHAALATVRAVAGRSVGVVVVLHDLNLAAGYADRIVLLKEGRVVTGGTPEAVLQADVLESVFDMRMTVLPHPHLPRPLVVPDPAMPGSAAPGAPQTSAPGAAPTSASGASGSSPAGPAS